MHSKGRVVLAVIVMTCLTTALASAQSTPTTSTTTETMKFEVVSLIGNDLVVRTPEGTRELAVNDDFRFMIDGRPMSVHELKPGMKGTATITTTTKTTPVTTTEIKNGTVQRVTKSSIIVQTPEGKSEFMKSDLDKRGVSIVRDGQPARASDLRAGDRLAVTLVTTMPPMRVTRQEVEATLAAAEAPPVAAPQRPVAPSPVPETTTASTVAPSEPQLPGTSGPLPLIGFAGLASLAIGATLAIRRRRLGR
jgi:hypothetical protein